MEYLQGTTAELMNASPGQDIQFLHQMASIQVELANIQHDRIGSIFEGPSGVYIGRDVETHRGPFQDPRDYYVAVISHRGSCCKYSKERTRFDDLNLTRMIFYSSFLITYNEQKFGLVNRDLGPHNLRVDEEFNIIGLIDLDFVLAGPLHVMASLPPRWKSELDLHSPNPGVKKRVGEYLDAITNAGRPDIVRAATSDFGGMWIEIEGAECYQMGYRSKTPHIVWSAMHRLTQAR